ncbi:MAG: matrixin family metalloprotease, partial [Burkholderiales bacterium]|nr:matrixin family metalloprotease [Burkholderiales bacterium]
YVIEVLGDEAAAGYCPKEFWKISSNLPTGTDDYTNWQNTANLSAMLANASQSLTSFSDLAGTAVGQTKRESSTAQITLDSTAAGHGWFIDTTPSNNEEFLPTSDPEVWIAKADSQAAGKMDMFSVLLHEYGHALGIEHSSDNADYMAASLQPGERRLPSGEELDLMARLVAAIKSE